MKQERQTLSRPDVFKVARWLELHGEQIMSRRMTAPMIADAIRKDIGVRVSEHSVRAIARDAGVELPRSNASTTSREKKERIRTVAHVLCYVIDTVRDLRESLGAPPDAILTELRSMAKAISNGLPYDEPNKADAK